jgi:hypothetical protein
MAVPSYVIPFRALLREIGLPEESGDETVRLTRDQVTLLIRKFLIYVPVDEVWYKNTYPDVQGAIDSGAFKSAKDHFVSNGYFEGRLPTKINVDVDFYTKTYPDVAERIEDGEITSAQEHFESHGFAEGRLPFEV